MKVLVFDCRKVLEINCRKMYVFTCFLHFSDEWGEYPDESDAKAVEDAEGMEAEGIEGIAESIAESIAGYTDTDTADYPDDSDSDTEISDDINKTEEIIEAVESEPTGKIVSEVTFLSDEDPSRKHLSRMYFDKVTLAYETTRFREVTFWVYATEYKKAPYTVKSIVAYEQDGSYEFVYGMNNSVTVNGVTFIIKARFNENRELSVSIIPETEKVNILNREDSYNNGDGIPEHFGLMFEDMEFYPVRQNVNGTCDCIVLKDGQAYLSHGNETVEDKTCEFILSSDVFEVVIS